MATWSNLTDTTARLNIEESDTGPFYRTKTLTGLEPNELYTFYVTVDTDAPEVEPLLEVVGGDTAIAEDGDNETLVARGESNGSGAITLRLGVQDMDDAPGSGTSDDLDYASQGAAEAAGWDVNNTTTNGQGTILFDTGHAIGPHDTSEVFRIHGMGGSGVMEVVKTYTLTAGAAYRAKLWIDPDGSGFEHIHLDISNTAGTLKGVIAGGSQAAGQRTTPGSVTAGGDGLITIRIWIGGGFAGWHDNDTYHFAGLTVERVVGGAATVDFSDIGPCLGTGTGVTGGAA